MPKSSDHHAPGACQRCSFLPEPGEEFRVRWVDGAPLLVCETCQDTLDGDGLPVINDVRARGPVFNGRLRYERDSGVGL